MAETKWNDKNIEEMERRLRDNLEKAAIYLKGKIKEKLNVTGNPFLASEGGAGRHYANENVSAPGEAPHKMLGNLQRSIAHSMSATGKEAFVGTNLNYGLYLELGTVKMEARPWLRPSLLENADTIARIIATGKR